MVVGVGDGGRRWWQFAVVVVMTDPGVSGGRSSLVVVAGRDGSGRRVW